MLKIRFLFITLLFCLLFAAAVFRLFDLQFVRSKELTDYRERRISQFEQRAPRRGRILDAKGDIIAEDQPTQDLWLAPVRQRFAGRSREYVSTLPPLTPEQMLQLAGTRGEERKFEFNLAHTALVEGNPMIAELSRRLEMDKEEVAAKLLNAAISGSPASMVDLIAPRLAIPDVDFTLALEIRSARANPYDEGKWRAVEIRTGNKRFYPAGPLLAHITGTVGKLTADEYVQLRGRWDGDDKIPGKGFLTKQGRLFFSMLDENNPDELTDEQILTRLLEIKREGKIRKTQAYFANETVGRGGLEQWYNQDLRGRHRIQQNRMVRDAAHGGRTYRPLGEVERAINGQDIRLSIDLDVQRKAFDIMREQIRKTAQRDELRHYNWTPSGVAIMMNPNNGRIYALVSLPSYDPNTFSRDFKKLMADPGMPLVDRALSGIYPPGSVVKPLVGLAGMTEDTLMPGQTYHCDHVLMLAGARFTCLGRHGDIDLEDALMKSCNIFFYHAGEALGSRRLYEWYSRLGLGHRTGIDVAGESVGILPKNAFTRRGWATGNTYHMSIGQGIAVTPLQIAVAYCALANARGNVAKIVRPHLLIPPPGEPSTPEEEALANEARRLDQPIAEIMVDPEAMAAVREGLWRVVQGRREEGIFGSGWQAEFVDGSDRNFFEIAGKTGTAEWSRVINGVPVKQVSHVWFAAYAPFDRPELVVIVMLPEAGGGGGGTCAPIAKELIRMWFNLPERPETTIGAEDALG